MGAHPDAYTRLRTILVQISTTRHAHKPGTNEYSILTDALNKYLDEWYDYSNRATEWDATGWGFNPDTWMTKERRQLNTSKRMRKGFDGRWYAVR